MPVSDHIKRLRDEVGHDLLLIPSVAVLPRDERAGSCWYGRPIPACGAPSVARSRSTKHPRDAACREAKEEAGIVVQLGRMVDVVGGPDYRIAYPNGDLTAYVSAIYEATVRTVRRPRTATRRPRPAGSPRPSWPVRAR